MRTLFYNKDMSKVYMLIGIQGSGKTTYAKVKSQELNIPIVSSDAIRDEMPELKEELVFPEVYRRCAEYIKSNTDFIYDATNVTPKVRKRLWENMASYGLKDFEVEAHYFVPAQIFLMAGPYMPSIFQGISTILPFSSFVTLVFRP